MFVLYNNTSTTLKKQLRVTQKKTTNKGCGTAPGYLVNQFNASFPDKVLHLKINWIIGYLDSSLVVSSVYRDFEI